MIVSIVTSRSAITSLNSLWKDRALSKELKVRLMRLLVWPVATYGCETWTLKASDRKRISAFEIRDRPKFVFVFVFGAENDYF